MLKRYEPFPLILTEDQIDDTLTTENVGIVRVLNAIESINGAEISFVILETSNGDYLQCAGNSNNLTIEFREHKNDKFKHFVIGPSKKETSPLKVSWLSLECKVGPFTLHDSEIFNKNSAKEVFKEFYHSQQLPKYLNFRNVTKKFVENGS